MLTVLSLVTSVKDYIEIAHKLVETQASTSLLGNGVDASTLIGGIKDYTELGSILTYVIFSIKEFLTSFFTLSWLKNIWSLPLIVPDIASAMISEISVLDSYFTNSFSFLESGLNTANMSWLLTPLKASSSLAGTQQNSFLYGFEKFLIGFLNSLFLFLPTSTSHLITVRRFVMQGLEAGYMAGLGTIAGNFLWLASIILGWRFIVIPWLSLDIFRYVLGFVLLVKYLWDSSKDLNKTGTNATLEDNAKMKIFALNFLLALTEQTSIYPFISNMSFGAEGSILEGFSGTIFQAESSLQFFGIHGCYLLGILLGSFSLLQFTVWFWENPAFSIYMWMVSPSRSYKVTTSSYYKVLNFIFLYLTMLCAISSIPYFGLDYTVTNPLGLIPQDRMIDQKLSTASGPGDKILQETAFLGVNPIDKNSRIRDGVHARRERWKERLIKYQAFDASLYDQGTYDILTIEDLNYGFDRFWLRRKMRNHQIRFRLFPGPWMRSLKKQLNKPGFTGPRVEFFRILFEQYYHPSFHATTSKKGLSNKGNTKQLAITNSLDGGLSQSGTRIINSMENKSLYIKPQSVDKKFKTKKDLITTQQYSALRKFARNFSNRTTAATLGNTNLVIPNNSNTNTLVPMLENKGQALVYSKSLKSLFNKIDSEYSKDKLNIFRNISKNILNPGQNNNFAMVNSKTPVWATQNITNNTLKQSVKKTNIRKKLSKKDRLLLVNKTYLLASKSNSGLVSQEQNQATNKNAYLQPLNFYFQKDQAFKRKLKYYSTSVTRSLTVGNNAPYFKTMLKRAFYYHKPSLRLKRTLFTAAMRRGFRKKSVNPKKVIYPTNTVTNINLLPAVPPGNGFASPGGEGLQANSGVLYPSTTSYSVLGKRASRYRYQIYKDVLQHWYYTPFNRLLLKFDIDSFINRQPRTHFLTKKEERLLHLRRVLLAEHYNTLRWYTYMQHYRTMKSRIGGSKSFANNSYNQQFQGTFKKIRHLFSITPSQGDMSILKFDQFLFNESNINLGNSSAALDLKATLVNQKPKTNLSNPTGTIHEELTSSQSTDSLNKKATQLPKDFIEQSLSITGQYVISEQNEKALKIKEYINQKNYAEITKLLYFNTSGQSSAPRNALAGEGLKSNQQEDTSLMVNNNSQQTNQILFQLLKECKRRLNDQAFLKNYVNHRIDKREQRYRETEKELKSSLENLKLWLSPISINGGAFNSVKSQGVNDSIANVSRFPSRGEGGITTTGVTKALNEGVYILNNINPAISAKTILLSNTKPLKFKDFALNKATEQEKLLQTVNSLNTLTNQIKTNKNSLNKVTASATRNSLLSIKSFINTVLKPVLFVQNRLLVKRSEKNLEWWRQKQRVMAKRQTSRKKSRFKTIQTNIDVISKNQSQRSKLNKNDSNFIDFIDSSNNLLLRRSNLATPNSLQNVAFNSVKSEQYSDGLRKKSDNTDNTFSSGGQSSKTLLKTVFENLFVKKFRKKASSKGRRFRVYSNRSARGFAYIKKPKKANNALTIQDVSGNTISLANFTTSAAQDTNKKALLKDLKAKLISVTTTSFSAGPTSNAELLKVTPLRDLKTLLIGFKQSVNPVQTNIKKSPIKKNTLAKRTMKRRKRHKFSRNLQRYRKRSLQGFGKLRMLSKKLRRIQATHELRNWWWNNYLPNYVNKQAKQASVNSVFTPSSVAANLTPSYKPLSTNKALDIAGKYNQYTNNNCSSSSGLNNIGGASEGQACKTIESNLTQTKNNIVVGTASKGNLVDQIYTDLLVSTNSDSNNFNLLKNYYNTTNIPFYAGWDESLRKFVVTNRLLSRRDAGFEVLVTQEDKGTNTGTSKVEFTKAPLQGLNEGSFLYLQNAEQLPFNAYNIDQFIPNNQSFYAPLGWKRFEFRHSLLKNWLNNVSGGFTSQASKPKSNSLDSKLNTTIFLNQNHKSNLEFFNNKTVNVDPFNSKSSKALQNRRIKKRYKLLKQTPIQLMYLPSGTLLTEVLPSHYISVFDKQYRFPRNRYLKRNLLKANLTSTGIAAQAYTKDLTVAEFSTALKSTVNQSPQFTLRKRVKPRRKYHKKRFTKKDSLIFPRRYKFGTGLDAFETKQNQNSVNSNAETFRLRPSAARSTARSNQNSKSKAKKRSPKANPIRLRQLRRREFQQVYKPLQRFQPRYGGFVWPGDYLRLDIIPMPKLESLPRYTELNSTSQGQNSVDPNVGISNKVKRNSAKINVQPVGLLPRKYLIQKHNLKVLKKKLALSLV